MENITALREKSAHLAKQAKNLLAEKGSATWTAEEQGQFDGYTNEIERIQAQIKSIEKMRDLEADKFFENAAPAGRQAGQADNIDALTAVALYLRHGNNVTAEQAIAIRNAMSTTTPAEGGYTVPAEPLDLSSENLSALENLNAGMFVRVWL